MSALFIIIGILGSNYPLLANTDEKSNLISVAKCCEHNELLVDDTCTPLTETNETEWRPEFIEEVNGISKNKLIKPNYQLKIGRPKCQSNERQWNVYHYRSGDDRLAILTNGVLRHYTTDLTKEKHEYNNVFGFDAANSIDEDNFETVSIHYDYPFGHYCADKAILSRDRLVAMYAMICVPDVIVTWSDTNYLMKHAIDPTFHAISIISYLIVAIIYFVLPQLRDLVGNMITSMTLCLITGQCASTVRIFTEFGNHISFMIAGMIYKILKEILIILFKLFFIILRLKVIRLKFNQILLKQKTN